MKPNDEAIAAAFAAAEAHIGNTSQREWLREILTAAYAAQFQSEDYAGLVEDLREFTEDLLNGQTDNCEQVSKKAADALEVVLAERDALKAELASGHMWIQMRAKTLEELAMVRTERDALKAELAAANKRAANRLAVEAERDALLARLAPVEAIENDKDDPTREYIPLPGGWEIQTKGRGSSYRLLDKKTGERHMILAGDAPFVQEFVTRMAKEINASAQVRPVAPVDDEALVEIAAKAISKQIPYLKVQWGDVRDAAIDAIAAIRPHIEAAAYEDAARFIEENVFNYNSGDQSYWSHRKGDNTHGLEYAREFREKAAAIRSGK